MKTNPFDETRTYSVLIIDDDGSYGQSAMAASMNLGKVRAEYIEPIIRKERLVFKLQVGLPLLTAGIILFWLTGHPWPFILCGMGTGAIMILERGDWWSGIDIEEAVEEAHLMHKDLYLDISSDLEDSIGRLA